MDLWVENQNIMSPNAKLYILHLFKNPISVEIQQFRLLIKSWGRTPWTQDQFYKSVSMQEKVTEDGKYLEIWVLCYRSLSVTDVSSKKKAFTKTTLSIIAEPIWQLCCLKSYPRFTEWQSSPKSNICVCRSTGLRNTFRQRTPQGTLRPDRAEIAGEA